MVVHLELEEPEVEALLTALHERISHLTADGSWPVGPYRYLVQKINDQWMTGIGYRMDAPTAQPPPRE